MAHLRRHPNNASAKKIKGITATSKSWWRQDDHNSCYWNLAGPFFFSSCYYT